MLVLFPLLLIVAILIAVTLRQRRGVRVTHPSCGKCGYNVTGNASLMCPECGADLRQVGILTPRMTQPIGPLGAVLIWSIALPLPAMFLSSLVLHFLLPSQRSASASRNFAGPASDAYQSIDVELVGREYYLQWRDPPKNPAVVELDLLLTTNDGFTVTLALEPSTLTGVYTTLEGDEASFDAFDRDAVLAWMAAAGVDTDDPRVRAEAAALAGAVTRVIQSGNYNMNLPGFGFTGSSYSGRSGQPLPGAMETTIALWLIVWLGGCFYWWRRMQRHAH